MALDFQAFQFLEKNLEVEASNQTLVSPVDSEIVRGTLRTYGSIYLVLVLLFCLLRKAYPDTYNIRSWSERVKSEMAKQAHFGYIDWFWKVWFVSDDDFREQCGMDALCFVRILRFGLCVALVGMFNSLYLMPVYGTSATTEDNAHITDSLAKLTIGYVPPGSARFLATVYIQSGSPSTVTSTSWRSSLATTQCT
jgi:hypothetical protein